MLFYHVTEREHADAILREGFRGGWGDLGFGVYFYGSLDRAEDYLAEGGWDGELKDPVILVVSDDSVVEITEWDLDPAWEPEKYEDMHWRPMDPDTEEAWKPASLALVEDTPAPAA